MRSPTAPRSPALPPARRRTAASAHLGAVPAHPLGAPLLRRWYMNGKVEIPVGNTTVWAQVGMNITIPGSAAWKEK